MARNTKHILLLLFAGTLVSLVLLAASLPSLNLQAGTPFPGSPVSNDEDQPVAPVSPMRVYSVPVLRGIVALILLIGMIYLPARLLSRASLKLILRAALILAALILLAYLLPAVTPAQPTYHLEEAFEVPMVPPVEYPVTPLGQPPQSLIWLVLTGVVLGMGVFVFAMVRGRWNASKIENELLQQAEGAMDALQAGMNLRNVIIRCYLQMTHAVQEEQALERNDSMTVREFEHWLEQKGFPSTPVRQLTSLFEKVRYSEQPASKDDEIMAAGSLNEIIQYCRNGKA